MAFEPHLEVFRVDLPLGFVDKELVLAHTYHLSLESPFRASAVELTSIESEQAVIQKEKLRLPRLEPREDSAHSHVVEKPTEELTLRLERHIEKVEHLAHTSI